ncbi:MAG TPA: TetR/AcrR family transcriptional regulator [Vicinamibacteria bacterium]
MTKGRLEPQLEDPFLDAAARLFRKKGFEATTVREIARAAKVLPGSLHYRYPSKAGLLLALMERGMKADLDTLRAAIDGVDDPAERVRLALRARVRFLVSRDSAGVVLFDWRSLRGPARAAMIRLRDEYEAFWEELLRAAARSGRLRPGLDLKLLRFLIFGAVNWIALWYSPDKERTPEEIADAFWGFIAFGVLHEGHVPRDVKAALRALSALEPCMG